MDDASKCPSGGSKFNWAVPIAISAACVAPAAVLAQTATGTSEQVAVFEEEIIVIAQKRPERLLDVPIATSVITSGNIQKSNYRNIQDLSATVPGFYVANDTGNNQGPLTIRGVGGAVSGGNVYANEPVAVYVDDAYIGRLRYSATDLLDVEAIEVLRGPQGTLYGRNSTAGAVLIRSAQPTAQLQSFVNVVAAQDDEYRFQGALSGPLTSSGVLAARLAVGYSDYDGWATNTAGDNLGSSKDESARLTFRFAPSENFTANLINEYTDHEASVAVIAVSDISNLADETTNPTGSNVVTPYVFRQNLDSVLDSDTFSLNAPHKSTSRSASNTLKFDWKLGGMTLTGITNYRQGDTFGSSDVDGTGLNPPQNPLVIGDVPNFGDNDVSVEDAQWSQELRLAAKQGALDWVAGVYYYGENVDVNPIRIRNRVADPILNGPAQGIGTQATFFSSQDSEAYAAFVDVSYNVTERLKLTGGGRYSSEDKDFRSNPVVTSINTFVGLPPNPAIPTGIPMIPAGTVLFATQFNGTADFSDFSPRGVVSYKLADKVSTYASFSEGFKSGGFNAFNVNPLLANAFQPEQITAYEIGLKSEVLDERLRLNTALFYYDYENLQVRTDDPQGAIAIQTVQSANVSGAEIEATFFATQNLRFDTALAYLDAEFKNGQLNAVLQQSYLFGNAPPVVPINVNGNDLSRSPSFQGSLSARYSQPMFGGRAGAQVAYRYQDSLFFLETLQATAPTFSSDSWNEVDARLSYGATNGRWEVAVYGKNLTDDRHLSQVGAFFGLPLASVNEPRRVGLQFTFEY